MRLSDWLLAHGDTAQFLGYFGLLAALIAAERLAPHRRGGPGQVRRWTANYGLTLLNVLAIGALPVSFVTVAAVAERHDVGLLRSAQLPLAVAIAASLLLRGFISYITHLLMHKVPLLWRIHRVHHLDTELDVSTTVRFHPLEFPVALAIGAPLVLAFGLSAWALILYELLDVAITLWSHANVRTPPWLDRLVRHLVVTPELHRVHHSTHPEETDSNFSAVFPIWDLLFGTLRRHPRAETASMPLGLVEVRDDRVRRLGWLLGVPFRRRL